VRVEGAFCFLGGVVLGEGSVGISGIQGILGCMGMIQAQDCSFQKSENPSPKATVNTQIGNSRERKLRSSRISEEHVIVYTMIRAEGELLGYVNRYKQY
jgi:hypothetical protein